MTINQAIYAVLDGTGLSSDDFPLSKRFIYTELKTARTELIKQELNKNNLLDSGSMQTINLVKFVRSEIYSYTMHQLKSEKPVPKAIEYNNGIGLFLYLLNGMRVSPMEQSSVVKMERRRYKLDGSIGFYMVNQRIVIVGYDDVDELEGSVQGHFDDPEAVAMLNEELTCGDNPCRPIFEYEFECPGLIERRVIEIAKASALRKLQIPLDASNNSQFDPNVKSSPQSAQR